jgi:hypothetical protein
MAQPISTQHGTSAAVAPASRGASAIVVGSAAVGVALLLGALALWLHYGTAVFFETITAGISACF